MSRKNPEKKKRSYRSSLEEGGRSQGPGGESEEVETILERRQVSEVEQDRKLSFTKNEIIDRAPERDSQGRIKVVRSVGVPAKTLTAQNLAVCFFPEQPRSRKILEYVDENPVEEEATRTVAGRNLQSVKDIFSDPGTDRGRWTNRLYFLVSFAAFCISFNSLYRFPMLLLRYGGGSFFIPYTITTILVGYPLFYLEASLGQYSQLGLVKVWACAPIATGVGTAFLTTCIVLSLYYNIFASYALVYFSRCFNSILPWFDCQNSSVTCVPRICVPPPENATFPTEQFFYNYVLDVDKQQPLLINGLGVVKWWLVLALFFAWFVVFVANLQGICSVEKVATFFVIYPYFCLIMLLSVGLQLEGSADGITGGMFASDLGAISNFRVWVVAVQEVLLQLGIAQGIPLIYGSFCRQSNPVHFDAAYLCVVNFFNSILCGLVAFSILGSLAARGVVLKTSELLGNSFGILFLVHTEGLLRIPGSKLWCFIFFSMIFTIVVGTQIVYFFAISTAIFEQFQKLLRIRWFVHLILCSLFFLFGFTFCTANGFYAVHFTHEVLVAQCSIPIAFFFSFTIVAIYGSNKYSEDMEFMLGFYPEFWIRTLIVLAPIFLITIWVGGWLGMGSPTLGGKPYAKYVIIIGWGVLGVILLTILLYAFYWVVYCFKRGQLRHVFHSLTTWGPQEYAEKVRRANFTSGKVHHPFTEKWEN